MKYTKGPWKISFHSDGKGVAGNVFRLDNNMTANEFMTTMDGNRQLIEAAPELLEALEMLLHDDMPYERGNAEELIKRIKGVT